MAKFWNSTKRWLPGAIFSLIAIAAILYFVDLHRFMDAIRSANYGLLLAFLLLSFFWLIIRGIVWWTLLRKQVPYRKVFWTLGEGYLLNNILPFRLGEFGRAFLLSRKSSLGFMEIFSTIIIERMVDVIYSGAILLIAVPFVVGAKGAEVFAIVIGGLLILGLILLYFISRNRERFMGGYDLLTRHSSKLQELGKKFLDPLLSGFSVLNNGWLFLRFFLWMTFNWMVAIFQFFILILAFFPRASLIWSFFGLGAVAFGNAIPSLPGAIGTFEASLAGALTLVSHKEATSLALAVTDHVIGYLVTGATGLYALSREGETLLEIYRQIRVRMGKPRVEN